MQIINLYRYVRDGGGVTVSIDALPDGMEHTTLFRIVAEDGMQLVKGGEMYGGCIDTDDAEGWVEVSEDDNGNAGIEDYQEALREFGVSVDD